ncbi:MAG: NADH-quinone oxidoreductase subunit M [Chthoniobacterales bacterium]|nr:NADH-quinone oxidoreductase subunit M [Chthoniobacterales bacterium]
MSPLLSLILIPLVTAAFCMAGAAPRRISLFGAGANLLLGLYLLASYSLEIGGFQFVSEHALFPAYGIHFSLGADGLSLVLILLATLVTFAAVWVTPKVEKFAGMFYACLLFISAGAIGAFASIDLFFFYAFHELALVPTFLLIGIWGSGERQRIAWKVTIYLAFGSFILLLGLIGLWLAVPPELRTLDIRLLQQLGQAGMIAPGPAVYLLLLFGFGILIALFPFHTWAPEAYASAPAPAAMLHAGVLKKFGLYGLLRLAVPIFPAEIQQFSHLLLVLLLGNILYVGFVTMAQKRLDLMLGYSSVMHMGYAFLGFAALNQLGLGGMSLMLFAHGLTIAALFALCGEISRRTGTLEFAQLGGLAGPAPKLGLLFGFAAMASIGLPGFSTFAAEIMIFFGAFARGAVGSFNWFQTATALALWGVVISAVYMLRACRNVFWGSRGSAVTDDTQDVSPGVRWAVILLVVGLLVTGFRPAILLDYLNPVFSYLAP